jgi:hypothetical protein
MKKKHIFCFSLFFATKVLFGQGRDTTFKHRKVLLLGLETAGTVFVGFDGGINKPKERFSALLWGTRLGGFVTPYLGLGLTGAYLHHKSNYFTPPDDIYKAGYFVRLYSPALRKYRKFGRKKKNILECELYLEFQHERSTATFANLEDVVSENSLKYNVFHFVWGSSTRLWRNLKLDLCLQTVWYPESQEKKLLPFGTRLGLDYFFYHKK